MAKRQEQIQTCYLEVNRALIDNLISSRSIINVKKMSDKLLELISEITVKMSEFNEVMSLINQMILREKMGELKTLVTEKILSENFS